MTSGGQETVVPDALDALADTIKSNVNPLVDAAKAAFTSAEVPGTAFSPAGLSMGVVYPGTRQWAIADCQSKTDELNSVGDRLHKTATYWREAEANSTIPWLGN